MGLNKFYGLPSEVPNTEFSIDFVQGMANRMAVSYFKYGPAKEAYPALIDAIATCKEKIDLYLNGGEVKGKRITPGNTEYLIDASNYLMLEFMYPRHPEAFFKATDSSSSTGRIWTDGSQSDISHSVTQERTILKNARTKRELDGD